MKALWNAGHTNRWVHAENSTPSVARIKNALIIRLQRSKNRPENSWSLRLNPFHGQIPHALPGHARIMDLNLQNYAFLQGNPKFHRILKPSNPLIINSYYVLTTQGRF